MGKLRTYIEFQVEFDCWEDLDFWSNQRDRDVWVDYEYKRVIFPIYVEDLVGRD